MVCRGEVPRAERDHDLPRHLAAASLLAGLAVFVMIARHGNIFAVMVGGFDALWSAFSPMGQAQVAIHAPLALFLMFRPGGILGRRVPGARQF